MCDDICTRYYNQVGWKSGPAKAGPARPAAPPLVVGAVGAAAARLNFGTLKRMVSVLRLQQLLMLPCGVMAELHFPE